MHQTKYIQMLPEPTSRAETGLKPQQVAETPVKPFERVFSKKLEGKNENSQNILLTQKKLIKSKASGMTLQDYFRTAIPARQSTYVARKGLDKPATHSSHEGKMTPEIEKAISKASEKYGVSKKMIRSIIATESNFNPKAVSPVGAQGLMQLMPGTARVLGVNNAFDIDENIDGGVRYFRQMLDQFNQDERLALAAYNAGPGAVQKYNGVPPYRETQGYVAKILKNVRGLGCLLIIIVLNSISWVSAASEVQQLHQLKALDVPSISSFIEAISPTREFYLATQWPMDKNVLEPMQSDYKLVELGVQIPSMSLRVDSKMLRQYVTVLDKIKKEIETSDDPYLEEKTYLKADLLLAFAWSQPTDHSLYENAFQAYREALEQFPESGHAIPASYNLGLCLLKMQQYDEASFYGHRQEIYWSKKKIWAFPFQAIVMESYFLRQRYERAEDYLWELATRINKDELSPTLALRYGDSLFWQKKYQDVVDWYDNPAIQKYLEADISMATLSRLYYAESLFQMGEWEQSLVQFEIFQEKYQGELPKQILKYRLLQLNLAVGREIPGGIDAFYRLSMDQAWGNDCNPSLFQWARLLAKSEQSVGVYATANDRVTRCMQQNPTKNMLREILYAHALLNWRLGDREGAYKTIIRLVPTDIIPDRIDSMIRAASDIAVSLLMEMGPNYWEAKDTMGFLMRADRLRLAIELTQMKLPALYWVGRAYIESGMITAGARLYQRILFELKPKDKSMIALELANTYGKLGELELMEKALAMVTEVPQTADARKLYFITKAAYEYQMGRYDICLEQLDNLLGSGVHGNEFFQFTYQGALCARKAGKYDRAQKYLELLGIDESEISDPKIPLEFRQWQQNALFEKVNLFATIGKNIEAIQLFESLKTLIPEFSPPLETLFLVIESYRKENQADNALATWKEFSEKSKIVSTDLKAHYSSLLETLSKLELVPNP